MEEFIKNINTLQPSIYRTYFIYRIWIKYRKIVEYSLDYNDYKTNLVLGALNIPKKYHKKNIVFPLSKFMFKKRIKTIDSIIFAHLIKVSEIFKNIEDVEFDERIEILKKQYDNLMLYIKENNEPSKLKDIINSFDNKLELEYISLDYNIQKKLLN